MGCYGIHCCLCLFISKCRGVGMRRIAEKFNALVAQFCNFSDCMIKRMPFERIRAERKLCSTQLWLPREPGRLPKEFVCVVQCNFFNVTCTKACFSHLPCDQGHTKRVRYSPISSTMDHDSLRPVFSYYFHCPVR